MSFDYKTPSDLMENERRKRRAEELTRLVPGLTSPQVAHALDRWCSILGSGTSMGEVDRGTFADFRTGVGLGSNGDSARV
jgi:hypothetical protein